MLNRSSARQMIAGTVFLYTPAIILTYIAFSGLLPLTYFVAIVWSILALTTWLFLRILIDYVGSLRNTFVVIYFPEASLFTLAAFLPRIASFNQRFILVVSFITILAYLIPLGLIFKAGKKEMETECIVDKGLTQRLKKILGSDRKVTPEVCIMPAPNYGKPHLAVQDIRRRRILITRQLTEMLSQDETDATLSYAYYLTKSHGSVKKTYILFTPFVALADAFIYFIMGGFPALGFILVPVTGILLILSIISFPILFPILFARFDYSSVIRADRFAVRTTRNPGALISAIDKIYNLKGNPKFTGGGLAYDLIRLNQKRHKQRMMRIERMRF